MNKVSLAIQDSRVYLDHLVLWEGQDFQALRDQREILTPIAFLGLRERKESLGGLVHLVPLASQDLQDYQVAKANQDLQGTRIHFLVQMETRVSKVFQGL